jgi:hypothetical protein
LSLFRIIEYVVFSLISFNYHHHCFLWVVLWDKVKQILRNRNRMCFKESFFIDRSERRSNIRHSWKLKYFDKNFSTKALIDDGFDKQVKYSFLILYKLVAFFMEKYIVVFDFIVKCKDHALLLDLACLNYFCQYCIVRRSTWKSSITELVRSINRNLIQEMLIISIKFSLKYVVFSGLQAAIDSNQNFNSIVFNHFDLIIME